MHLYTSVERLPNVGSFYQKKLNKLGIKTAEDLLFHFPHKYEDFSGLVSISKVKDGEKCSVKGKVIKIENKRIFKKKMVLTEAIIEDESGKMKAIWFNQSYVINNISEGETFVFSGKVSSGKGRLSLTNPSYKKADSENNSSGEIVPIYPETRGMTSRQLRFIIRKIFPMLEGEIKELIPIEIIKEKKLLAVEKAIEQIHFPQSLKKAEEAKKRFSFEQIFLIQMTVLSEKIRLSKEKSFSIPPDIKLIQNLISSLDYQLTDDQKKSAWQILKDLEKTYPMNRLLEGDVGSGKTIVATIAALNAIKSGFQVSIMAPTEILAKQHFNEIFKLIRNFNINIGLLTGKQDRFYSKKLKTDYIEISKKKLLEKTLKGEINLLIGTHALIQDQVKFKNLALVVLDEQHRFGVKQRAKLAVKDNSFLKPNIPHLLSMTATPIPRTLALSVYGDLDISLIKEMPQGRKKITTEVIEPEGRKKIYSFVKKEIEKGRQVFVVCPRIEPSDESLNDSSEFSEKKSKWFGVKAVKQEYEKLSKEIFPQFNVGIIHGKIKVKEKEKTMLDFKNKKIDILVSTSVIEVGIDVPNATIMIIEGAERFGLAQLHQFRGRVGRGKSQSYCFLFPESSKAKTKRRLKALVSCHDGFSLSEKDLEIRGPGDFMGTRQWGIPDIIMDSLKDFTLVQESKEAAKKILEKDYALRKYPFLKRKIQELRKKIHLE